MTLRSSQTPLRCVIIACPCALRVSDLPQNFVDMVAPGVCARRLSRTNAEALEWMENVDTLVVDKTGTLTAGSRASSDLPRSARSARTSAAPRLEPRTGQRAPAGCAICSRAEDAA